MLTRQRELLEQRVSASFNLWQLRSKEIIKYGGAGKTMKGLSSCVQKERKKKRSDLCWERSSFVLWRKKNPNLFVSRGHDLKREKKNDHRNNYIFFFQRPYGQQSKIISLRNYQGHSKHTNPFIDMEINLLYFYFKKTSLFYDTQRECPSRPVVRVHFNIYNKPGSYVTGVHDWGQTYRNINY